jgi:low affinity Fe/Cu permease
MPDLSARRTWFDRFSKLAARHAGRSATFTLATAVVLLWLLTGPLFGYSDTWQLAINTATTIVTFLMVFLIQHTQNIDAQAMQIKMDELIRATKGAHNALLDLEEMTEKQLDELRDQYEDLARQAHSQLGGEDVDTGSPEVPYRPNGQAPPRLGKI